MKTRRTGSVLSLSKTRCKKKLRSGTVKWGRRILFVGSLFLILQLGNIIYSNTWKSETDYNSEDHELDEQVHHGRKLLSEGVVWEQCHFEKAHTPHAFLPLYIFLIFLLFVGKKYMSTYDTNFSKTIPHSHRLNHLKRHQVTSISSYMELFIFLEKKIVLCNQCSPILVGVAILSYHFIYSCSNHL